MTHYPRAEAVMIQLKSQNFLCCGAMPYDACLRCMHVSEAMLSMLRVGWLVGALKLRNLSYGDSVNSNEGDINIFIHNYNIRQSLAQFYFYIDLI